MAVRIVHSGYLPLLLVTLMSQISCTREYSARQADENVLADPPSGATENPHALNTLRGAGAGLPPQELKRHEPAELPLSKPVVMGALPKEAIQDVINQNKAQIRGCYEAELQRNENLGGRIMTRWTIEATGRVANVQVTESTMNSPNVERCITERIGSWVFPPPSGGGIVEVNYPFVFRAG